MTFLDLHEIPLASIEVGTARARDLDPAWAEALSALIAQQGLLQPIIVRPIDGQPGRFRLVIGLHRLEAHRLLGREAIPAFLSAAESDDAARLEEVMENLGRYDLIALDRCHHLFELKQVWERMYPESAHGGDRKSIKRQSLPLDPTGPEIFGFSEANAEKVGLSARSIRLAVKIWQGLYPGVRARLRGTALASKQTELKSLSELPINTQVKVLDLILGTDHPGIENVAAAVAFLERGSEVTPVEKQFRAVDTAFGRLSDAAADMIVANHADRIIASLQRLGRI